MYFASMFPLAPRGPFPRGKSIRPPWNSGLRGQKTIKRLSPTCTKRNPIRAIKNSSEMRVFSVERSKSVSSSLKKASPTEGEKKVVSFADSMGLDLCQVRPIFPYNTSDEDILSSTPPSSSNLKSSQPRGRTPQPSQSSLNCPRYLQLQGSPYPLWRDPLVVQKELTTKAKKFGVALKSSSVMGMTFSGVVAVSNVAFEKRVFVRYSVDDWRSFVDTRCHFLHSHPGDRLDLFSFSIYLPPSMPVGARCHFCIRYESAGKEFWDNNDGQNYVLEVRSLGDAFAEKEFEPPLFY